MKLVKVARVERMNQIIVVNGMTIVYTTRLVLNRITYILTHSHSLNFSHSMALKRRIDSQNGPQRYSSLFYPDKKMRKILI